MRSVWLSLGMLASFVVALAWRAEPAQSTGSRDPASVLTSGAAPTELGTQIVTGDLDSLLDGSTGSDPNRPHGASHPEQSTHTLAESSDLDPLRGSTARGGGRSSAPPPSAQADGGPRASSSGAGWSLASILGLADWSELGLAGWNEPSERASVLVVLVRSDGAVRTARRGVGDERVLHEANDGFALRERQIVAASRDAAGRLIAQSDWLDLPLEIVGAAEGDPTGRRPGAERAPATRAR